MAQLKLHAVIESLRGGIGDLVFKQRKDGTSYVARKPEPSGKQPTANQQRIRDRFILASDYAKSVLADPRARAVYEAGAKAKNKPTFAFAMTDFLSEPKVNEIDVSQYNRQAGDKIYVRALDDFEVTGVEVTIRNGQVVESGAAVKTSDGLGRWVYTATSTVASGSPLTVEATATDRPGNKGTKSETLQ